jgi:hypothetical protein
MDDRKFYLALPSRAFVLVRAAHGKRDESHHFGVFNLAPVEDDRGPVTLAAPRFEEPAAREHLEVARAYPKGSPWRQLVAFEAIVAGPEEYHRHRLGKRVRLTKGEPRDPAGIDDFMKAAQRHGENNEPDDEVGDLQAMLFAAFRLLSPGQRLQFFQAEELLELADVPEYDALARRNGIPLRQGL